MKSQAIVLRSIKYNDETLIVHLLTAEMGCVGMTVRVSRSRRAAVRHTLFQPLAVLDIEWDHRPKASLQRPKNAAVALPLVSLPYDPYKSAIALFLAEFLYYALRSEPQGRSLFDYVSHSVAWLDACARSFSNFHLVFLLRLTRFLGFLPNVEDFTPGAWFDLRSASFVARQPLHPDCLCPADAALVPKLLRMRYDARVPLQRRGAFAPAGTDQPLLQPPPAQFPATQFACGFEGVVLGGKVASRGAASFLRFEKTAACMLGV